MADGNGRKKRRNSVGRLLEDLVDETTDLVGDVLGSVGDRRDEDLASLQAALDDLSAKVERLVALQGRNGKVPD